MATVTKTVQHHPFGGGQCRTIVTLKDFPVNVNNPSAAGVALGDGAPLFEISDGVAAAAAGFGDAGGHNVFTQRAAVDVLLKDTTSGTPNAADTPELGIGTVVASGAIATLGAGAATMENIFDGTAVADCSSTYLYTLLNSEEVITATQLATDSTVFLNVADTWTGIMGASKLTATGVILIDWCALPGISS